MASGETIIKHKAKSTYDGAIATLNIAHRAIGFNPAAWTSHCQTSTTGATETPHTTVCTATSETMVQAMRQATTARPGPIREAADITGVSHA